MLLTIFHLEFCGIPVPPGELDITDSKSHRIHVECPRGKFVGSIEKVTCQIS